MQTFTGWEYLAIDVANNAPFGLDKKTFEERITWFNENLGTLEDVANYAAKWKSKPMYLKAVAAVRKAQAGKTSGHLVGFDAVCSGMQIMSALTGCHKGADATGLVDPNRRADAYTDCTDLMANELGRHIPGERDKVKNAVMTSLYGSKDEPKKEFGDGTDELNAFYKAMYLLCPGACELLQALLASWQAYALEHSWVLPDGFQARVNVMQKIDDCRVEVDELGSSFTYVYYVNEGEAKGVKNAANVVHSVDAYVLRSLIRRCSYDEEVVRMAWEEITLALLERTEDLFDQAGEFSEKVAYYYEQYQRSGMSDPVILDHLTTEDLRLLPKTYLHDLNQIVSSMLEHRPFEIVTVHDDFKCHPNNMNHLRAHYRDILAELAEGNLLDDVLSQVNGWQGHFPKKSTNLGSTIRQSNYALC
jgi:hypothetical protein